MAVTLNSNPPIASATGISVAMPTEHPLFFFGSGGATSAEAMPALISSHVKMPTAGRNLTLDVLDIFVSKITADSMRQSNFSCMEQTRGRSAWVLQVFALPLRR
jgi:hypothetical protein